MSGEAHGGQDIGSGRIKLTLADTDRQLFACACVCECVFGVCGEKRPQPPPPRPPPSITTTTITRITHPHLYHYKLPQHSLPSVTDAGEEEGRESEGSRTQIIVSRVLSDGIENEMNLKRMEAVSRLRFRPRY